MANKPKQGKLDIPQPLQDRILVSPEIPEQKSAGGIIIPETSLVHENEGTVLAVGPLVGIRIKKDFTDLGLDLEDIDNLELPTPQVGDHILYAEHVGTKIVHKGRTYFIMKESDVMAIL